MTEMRDFARELAEAKLTGDVDLIAEAQRIHDRALRLAETELKNRLQVLKQHRARSLADYERMSDGGWTSG